MTAPAAAPPTPRRAGVDVARAIALIGMMVVHVLPGPVVRGSPVDRDPATAAAYALASGRSAALFAVLAGVGLALGRPSRAEVVVRALAVAAIGLTLGVLPTPVAVILVYYGVLFLLALPFLRLPARWLALLASIWVLAAPIVSHLLRAAGLAAYPVRNPQWEDLARPLAVARSLLLTGYYPALTWIGYLLAGLAVGTLLRRRPTGAAPVAARDPSRPPPVPHSAVLVARRLVVAGGVAVVAARVLGAVTLRVNGGVAGLTAALEAGTPNTDWLTGRGDDLLGETFFGTTPSSDWWWLGIDAPHSGSVADLLDTGGSALLVLGLVLLAVPWLSARVPRLVRPFAAAGSMTLTLYSVHVALVGLVATLEPADRPPPWLFLAAQVVVALVVADRWRFGGPEVRRGPLEELVSVTTDPVRGRT